MQRREITAEVVAEAGELARFGMDAATMATHLGITPYLARLLIRSAPLPSRVGVDRSSSRRVRNIQPSVDIGTIRRIQRMLEVGWLSHQQIAREAGVSANFVADVASGRRSATNTSPIGVGQDEEFLTEPARCVGCGAMICIVPCRACRTSQHPEDALGMSAG